MVQEGHILVPSPLLPRQCLDMVVISTKIKNGDDMNAPVYNNSYGVRMLTLEGRDKAMETIYGRIYRKEHCTGDYCRFLILSYDHFKLSTYQITDSPIRIETTATEPERLNDAINYSTFIQPYWIRETDTSLP